MTGANKLLRDGLGVNWTTLPVMLCEIRQEIGSDVTASALGEMVAWLESRPERACAVEIVVAEVVARGSVPKQCYMVRVCSVVRSWMQAEQQGPPPRERSEGSGQAPDAAEEQPQDDTSTTPPERPPLRPAAVPRSARDLAEVTPPSANPRMPMVRL